MLDRLLPTPDADLDTCSPICVPSSPRGAPSQFQILIHLPSVLNSEPKISSRSPVSRLDLQKLQLLAQHTARWIVRIPLETCHAHAHVTRFRVDSRWACAAKLWQNYVKKSLLILNLDSKIVTCMGAGDVVVKKAATHRKAKRKTKYERLLKVHKT